MYISQVKIDTENRRKMKELSHLGVYHSRVEDCFPYTDDGSRSGSLWRVDTISDEKYLLIVSKEKPDVKALEKFGIEGSALSKSYDKYLSSIKKGDKLTFRVTLNPTVSKREDSSSKRGRVYPLLNTEDQEEFLRNRSKENGFSLGNDDFYISEKIFMPLNKKGKKAVNLSKVSYEGILKVEDEELFYETLTNGFGKKKAYGCGLLTVMKM